MLIDPLSWGISSISKPFTCSCGTAYMVWSEKGSAHDPGELRCEICDELIYRWDGSRAWYMKRGHADRGNPATPCG